MKIFRGPKTAKKWSETDSRELSDFEWSPNSAICFDATVDKNGTRHTDLGINISENDIISLHEKLITHYKKRIEALEAEIKSASEENSKYFDALGKISNLVSLHRDKAPSGDDLLLLIENISDFYRFSFLEKEEDLNVSWIDLENL
ncbi:MAG: hypothetical protein R2940_08815 [Syntrophotaleaceae bacterium]